MTEKEKALELVMKYYNLKKRPLISFWKDTGSRRFAKLKSKINKFRENFRLINYK